jgi:HTH-type transcriptional regulator/antitoxin HigA
MSEITRVQTEAEYDAALQRISELLDAEMDTPEGEELDRISTLVEIYEAEHYPIERPDPNSLIEFLLDQGMVTRKQMEALAGGSDTLDAILARRLAVAPALAQLLHEHTGIPIEHLLESQAQDTTVVIAD